MQKIEGQIKFIKIKAFDRNAGAHFFLDIGGQSIHDRLCLPGCAGLPGLNNRKIQGFASDCRIDPGEDAYCEQDDYGERSNLFHANDASFVFRTQIYADKCR